MKDSFFLKVDQKMCKQEKKFLIYFPGLGFGMLTEDC